jgi:subtilisin family serine protease
VSAGAQRIGAVNLPFTGAGIGVAIADTGLDSSHQDLNVSPIGFTAHGSSHQDDNGHGTHCGGIVAAKNNTIDTVGVAPDVVLYSVKVLNAQGSGFDSDIIAGFDWIAQNANLVTPAIRAVNVSLGRPGTLNDNPLLRQSVQVLYNMNITVCVAAGNDCTVEVSRQVPAVYPEVIAVGSTTAQAGSNRCRQFSGFIDADTASYFTTDGDVDISAPGENREDISRSCFIRPVGILSSAMGGGTTRMYGTSQATPHVTGVAALLYEQDGTLDAELIRIIIQNTASGVNATPLDSPSSCYTFDGIREGVLSATRALDLP